MNGVILSFIITITIVVIIKRKQKLWVSGDLMREGKVLKGLMLDETKPSTQFTNLKVKNKVSRIPVKKDKFCDVCFAESK